MDDLVAQFSAITDAEAGKAASYLRLTDGNLEQAIQLYFEDPNLAADAPAASQPAAQPPPRASRPAPRPRTYAEDESGVVYIPDDSEEELDDNEDEEMGEATDASAAPPAPHQAPHAAFGPTTDDDEAIARRLQEEMYSAAGRGQEDIRAPMGRTTETLVGPGAAPWGDEDDMVAVQMAARQARRQHASRTRDPSFSFRFILMHMY
jgi:hypothetical protein